MKIEKKLNQKTKEGRIICSSEVDHWKNDKGPYATVIGKGWDSVEIEGIYKSTIIDTSNACYVDIVDVNSNGVFSTEDIKISRIDSETVSIIFQWTGLEFGEWYRGYTMHVHFYYYETHYAEYKPITDFELFDWKRSPYIKFRGISNITQTSVTCKVESYAGQDLNANDNSWTDKVLMRGKLNDPTAQTSSIPGNEVETNFINLKNLQPGTTYSKYTLSDVVKYYGNGDNYERISDNVRSFTTLYKTEKPSFTIFEKVINDSVSIEYVLDMGSDQYGEDFLKNGPVILYDQDDNEISSNINLKGEFLVENLSNGIYEGWYLSAKTSYSSEAIIGKINTFVINVGDIVVPYFSDYAVVTSDTSVEISYQFNLGKDPNGDPYKLIGIILYNERDQIQALSNESGDTLTVENLELNTTYSNWYLSGLTSYSNDPAIQLIDDFTTTSKKKRIKSN